jgi:hypothetical protein
MKPVSCPVAGTFDWQAAFGFPSAINHFVFMIIANQRLFASNQATLCPGFGLDRALNGGNSPVTQKKSV